MIPRSNRILTLVMPALLAGSGMVACAHATGEAEAGRKVGPAHENASVGPTAHGATLAAEASGAGEGLGHSTPLRTGTLPNGLRYYVRSNAMPAARAHLWLAVNVGSAQEDDDQLGYAHFLEHMAFNGTENFPRQELIDFIESTGMRFGPDLNAYTSFDETVYQITVPTDDPSFLERGLLVLEDWAAGRITLDPEEVVAERGVVLGEWRTRMLTDSVTERLREHEFDVTFGETPYRDRLPIGTPESIEAATTEPLRRFYEDWYRPDLMAVIAVGDFDTDAVEREIRERFGRIPMPSSPRERIAIEVERDGAPLVDIVRDRVSPGVQLIWPAASPPSDPRAWARSQIIEEILLGHLQRQLQRIREQDRVPFVNASVGRQQIARPLRTVGVNIYTWPDSLDVSLSAVLTEVERVARDGVAEASLERRKAALLRRLEHETARSSARASAGYAEAYTQHFLTGEGVLLDAEERLALAHEVMREVTPETVAEAARFWRDEAGLKVLVRIPEFALGFRPPTEEGVLAVFDSIRSGPLGPEPGVARGAARVAGGGGGVVANEDAAASRGAAAARAAGPDDGSSTVAPVPGSVVEERRHEEAGVIEWTLSNGARVFFKESLNDPDDLRIRAWSPGGRVNIPDSLYYTSGRMVAHVMNEAAGLGDHDRDDLVEALETTGVRQLRVDIGYTQETIDVAGSPGELERLFETLHLQFTAPKLDSAALAAWANMARFTPRAPESPLYQLDQMFARGLQRYVPVQTFTAELANVEEMLAVHQDRFGNAGDFTFFVVGAASESEVRELVERYVASLPATEARETPNVPERRPFRGTMRNRNRIMPIARAEVMKAYDGPFPTEAEAYLRETERLRSLTLVLERRLRDRLREEIAGTYGVGVTGYTYRLFDEHFRVLVQFQSDPELTVEMVKAMLEILGDVRAAGADEEELTRVATILRRQLETRLQNNLYWLDQLELYHRLDLPIDRITSPYTETALTAEELRQAAEAYLPRDAFVQMIVEPTEEVMQALRSEKAPDEEAMTRAAHRPAIERP